MQNNTTPNIEIKPTYPNIEPVWGYEASLKTLEKKVTVTCKDLETKFNKLESEQYFLSKQVDGLQEQVLNKVNSEVTPKLVKSLADLENYKITHTAAFTKLQEELLTEQKKTSSAIVNCHTSINNLYMLLNKAGLDVKETTSSIKIKAIRPNGNITEAEIKKPQVDGKSIVLNGKGEFALKYNFETPTLRISPSAAVNVVGLQLQSGKVITADSINNDLSNATYNIGALTNKLETILNKFNNINIYVMSNNFKTSKPCQAELDEFAIKSLSSSIRYVKKEEIPAGTRIKNLHDNHIWVFNKFILNGITTYKWEDYGSDLICTATNDKTLGVVKGSNERFRGHVDLTGVISINGLEEELQIILTTISTLEKNLLLYEKTLSEHINHIDKRLDALEGR